MAKLRKSARGKRRWVGLDIVDSIQSREELEAILSQIICLGDNFRLYDFNQGKAIIRIPLEVYNSARPILQEGTQGIVSVTSSGKIKLVRVRMGLEVKRRKR